MVVIVHDLVFISIRHAFSSALLGMAVPAPVEITFISVKYSRPRRDYQNFIKESGSDLLPCGGIQEKVHGKKLGNKSSPLCIARRVIQRADAGADNCWPGALN